MAISYDSSGNPQVDYVWGNMPLQGNTQRGVTAPVAKTTYNYQNDWDNVGGMFSIDLASATEVEAGWIITATAGAAGYTQVTKEFTVESVSMGSPGYYVRTKEAFDPAFQAAGQSSPSAFSTSIAPALNRGGGAGDKGWSKTTLVKSPNLNPALDGHNIATEFWNNYPGHTPNAGFVPQQAWQGTVLQNFSLQIQDEFRDPGNTDSYGEFAAGYVIYVGSGAVNAEETAALSTAVATNALIGQRVPALSYNDSYGNVRTRAAGHIVGADENNGMYGTQNFTIRVAVDNYTPIGMDYLVPGTVVTLGIGAAKNVLASAVIGTDIATFSFQPDPYANFGYALLQAPGNNYNNLSAEVKALVGADLSGAYIGANKVSQSPNVSDQSLFLYNFYKITGAEQYLDMYGNPAGVKVVFADQNTGWGMWMSAVDYETGDSVVVIK